MHSGGPGLILLLVWQVLVWEGKVEEEIRNTYSVMQNNLQK